MADIDTGYEAQTVRALRAMYLRFNTQCSNGTPELAQAEAAIWRATGEDIKKTAYDERQSCRDRIKAAHAVIVR